MEREPKRDETTSVVPAAARQEILRRKVREWRDPNDPDWAAHHDEMDDDDPTMPDRDG